MNEQFHMQKVLLDSYYENSVSNGMHIFAVLTKSKSFLFGHVQ